MSQETLPPSFHLVERTISRRFDADLNPNGSVPLFLCVRKGELPSSMCVNEIGWSPSFGFVVRNRGVMHVIKRRG